MCVNTTKEFWRMVWENKVTTVVMLSKCYEEGKVSDRDDDNDEIIITTTTIQ